MADDAPVVTDDRDGQRFELEIDGHMAELTYRVQGDRILLDHTGVPEELGGRGLGGRLVEAAMERARTDSLTVVPHCPFVQRWLEKHPDEAATVTVDWSES